jgi:sarcosine oxidase delta subunit
MNYIIPEGFNFYEELNKNLKAQSSSQRQVKEVCLITGDELDETSITLECGHSFNYLALFNDLFCYKYDKPQGYHSYSDNLNLRDHQIRCPYCRQVQEKILPYHPDIESKRVKGINHPPALSMGKNTCTHVFKSGKNKGRHCGKKCYRQMCNQHFKVEVKIEDLVMNRAQLNKFTLVELRRVAKAKGAKKYSKLKKTDLINILLSI